MSTTAHKAGDHKAPYERHRFTVSILAILALLIATIGAASAYVIQRGDTLSELANRWDTSVTAIMRANPKITNPDRIYAGDTLRRPGVRRPGRHHRVPLLKQRPHGQLIVPVRNSYVSQWYQGQYPAHNGIDFAGPYGTPVRAVARGRVIGVHYWEYSYGHHVLLQHAGGQTRYAHMGALKVRHGQRVRRGQVIGYRASTGHSTGSHLHFELWKHGRTVNPAPYIW